MAWPTIIAECQFDLTNWTDISQWVQEIDITRGVSRVDSPLLRFETGQATVQLDNRDRRFDPTNLAGPYTASFTSTTGVQLFKASAISSYGHGFTIDVKSATGQTAAIVNVTSVASGTTGSFTCPKPTGTANGHRMIVIHSCDVGVTGSMTLSGGAAWTTLNSRSYGSDTIQTKVYYKTAGGSEPSTYSFGQDSNADGVAIVITISGADTLTAPVFQAVDNIGVTDFQTPATTPSGINDLELRYVAATWPDGNLNWQSPTSAGYTEYVDKQSNVYTAVALAIKPLSGFGEGSDTLVLPNRPIRIKCTYPFTATTNYVLNPSLEDGTTTSWNGSTAQTTLASTMEQSRFGGSSLKVVRNATEPNFNLYGGIATTAAGPTTGQTITVSCYVYIPSASYSKVTAIAFTATGFASTFVTKPPAADGWYRLALTKTLTANLAVPQIQFWTDNTHSDGQTVAYVDGFQAEIKNSATNFCDGSQPGCSWDGTVNNSSSTRAATATFNLFRGFTDQWNVTWDGDFNSVVEVPCSDGFKLLTGNSRAAVAPVGSGEDSGARVGRILDSANWSVTDRVISTGDVALQATTLEGEAKAELDLVADTEIGELYIDEQGRVVFRNRTAVLSDTRAINIQARFGDGGDIAGEMPYNDVEISNDAGQIANLVRITRVGGAAQTAQDNTSINSYSNGIPQAFERDDLIMTSDAEALSYAQWVLYIAKNPELRFDALSIKPQKDEDLLFPQVLGRQFGDRIEIHRRPVGGGDPVIREVFIRGVHHEIRPYDWETHFVLQSATKIGSFLTLNHPTLGIIGQNALIP